MKVMVAQALDITRETYFALLMDREHNGPVMVGSPAGGMDIEEVAASTPELIFKVKFVICFVNLKKIKLKNVSSFGSRTNFFKKLTILFFS